MEAHGGPRSEGDLGGIGAVGIEDVDGAQLIELAAGVGADLLPQLPWRKIKIAWAHQVPDAGAVVALLDFVPPALALVFDHGGLLGEHAGLGSQEVEQGRARAGHRGVELPAGEDGGFGLPGPRVRTRGARVFACRSSAGAGETGVDRFQQLGGDRCFGEREQKGGLQLRAGALRVGIEASDGLDLVAEEVDANGPVVLGREDVEDAAAHGDLTGHLDNVDLGVAHGGEVVDQHVGQVLFAFAQVQREGGVVVAREEAHASGLHRRDDKPCLVGSKLPERGGSLLLNLRVGRDVFKRQHIVRRQAQDFVAAERAGEVAGGEHVGVQELGGFVVGDEDQRGRAACRGR